MSSSFSGLKDEEKEDGGLVGRSFRLRVRI